MKRFLLLALCAIFALDAGARTLYVDAKRPNNKGNALSAKKAKKTIQAAINVAKKGDTILVLPGTYAPIKTKNKRITIKSAKGKEKTSIRTKGSGIRKCLANLGAWEGGHLAYDRKQKRYRDCALYLRSGTASTLAGFSLRGQENVTYPVAATGGTLRHCSISRCGEGYMYIFAYTRSTAGSKTYAPDCWPVVYKSKLIDCSMTNCESSDYWLRDENTGIYCVFNPESGLGICQSTLIRCTVTGNRDCRRTEPTNRFRVHDSKFYNCLIAENQRMQVDNCLFANCTIANNPGFSMTKSKVRSCIVHGCGSALFKSAKRNKFSATFKDNRDPRFVDSAGGEYHLRSDSPCIGRGSKVAGTGTTDLDRNKRVRGGIDMGCFEYFADQPLTLTFADFQNCGASRCRFDRPFLVVESRTGPRSETYGSFPEPRSANRIFAGWWTDPFAGRLVIPGSAFSTYRLYAHWIDIVCEKPWDEDRPTTCNARLSRDGFGYDHGKWIPYSQSIRPFDFVIPAKIDGLRVTGLGWLESEVCSMIRSVVFPESMTVVNASFDEWSSLESVKIPASVQIVYDSFENCPNLKTIWLQNGSPIAHDDEDGVYYDLVVPDGCSIIRY